MPTSRMKNTEKRVLIIKKLKDFNLKKKKKILTGKSVKAIPRKKQTNPQQYD